MIRFTELLQGTIQDRNQRKRQLNCPHYEKVKTHRLGEMVQIDKPPKACFRIMSGVWNQNEEFS